MARKPTKPRKTAEQREAERVAARARDLEGVNLPGSAAVLPQHDAIEVTRAGEKREGQKAAHDSARRLDAFSALKDGMLVGAYDAARRLEADVLARLGIYDRTQGGERVDRTGGHTTDAMRAAGVMVDRVLGILPARDGNLLCELINPPFVRGTWRDHVQYMTGEANPVAQGALVRNVCANLRDAYQSLEQRKAAA